jgi:hypothetical protein
MDDTKHRQNPERTSKAPNAESERPKKKRFEPPKVITYSGDDLLEELGPAHACSPFSGSVVSC